MNRITAARGVQVLHKTLDILETIRDKQAGLRLADLARSVQMPKPTVYRIVATLEARGYLDRNENGSYRMARKLFDLQRDGSFEQILNQVAEPRMKQLVHACKETVNLGILDAGEVVVISAIESPQAVRMSSKIGNRRYLHSTALGKILLAGLPDNEVLRLLQLKGLRRLTPHTLVAKSAILREIRRLRRQGYALDNQENELGGRCVAAPILAPDGRVAAALSISAPVYRMDLMRARSLVGKLTEVCGLISKAMRV